MFREPNVTDNRYYVSRVESELLKRDALRRNLLQSDSDNFKRASPLYAWHLPGRSASQE